MTEKLNPLRQRPRFKIYTDLGLEECAERLKNQLTIQTKTFQGNINREIANIWVKTEHNEFWKPYLSLRTEYEEHKTVIRGIFGPSPAVWTFFMFLYFIFGITLMVFATIWLVTKQIKSNDFSWAVYATFFSSVCLVLTFLATKFGQRKAKKEMKQLREFAVSMFDNLEK